MPTPIHASVEDITSLKSVKKILLQLYGIRKATVAVFSTPSLFLVTVTGRAAAPGPWFTYETFSATTLHRMKY